MTSVDAANTLVSALVLASIYSLVSLGYVVVYRATGVFNFLHPEFMLYGALLFTSFSFGGAGGFSVGVLIALVVVVLGAVLVYRAVVHRAAGQPHWVQMIMTLGLATAALNLAQLIWGSNLRFVMLPFERTVWHLPGGAVLTSYDAAILGTCVIVSIALYRLLTKSGLGVRLRASAENPVLGAYSGIPLGRSFSIAWALAAAAAVLAGIAYSIRIPLDPSLAEVGLLAFPAAMIGGMDSIGGAFVGALILAVLQQFANTLLNAQAATGISFLVVFAILVFRPRGLFGSPVVERV
jgi:branched-chain amino acid transport system permease protein